MASSKVINYLSYMLKLSIKERFPRKIMKWHASFNNNPTIPPHHENMIIIFV
jgi:hypothetical protein